MDTKQQHQRGTKENNSGWAGDAKVSLDQFVSPVSSGWAGDRKVSLDQSVSPVSSGWTGDRKVSLLGTAVGTPRPSVHLFVPPIYPSEMISPFALVVQQA